MRWAQSGYVFCLLMVLFSFDGAAEYLAKPLETTLVPGCRECISAEEAVPSASIDVPNGASFEVISSRLILMDENGETLASIENPYGLDGTTSQGWSRSGVGFSEFGRVFSRLAAGSYSAVLKVDELYSNIWRFNVVSALPEPGPTPDGCQGLLEIEPIEEFDGRERPNAFLAYFRNKSSNREDIARAIDASRLEVDGKEYHLGILFWIGFTGLGPGESWGHVVDVDSYLDQRSQKIDRGKHAVRYQFAGCSSNTIRIKVEK